MGAAPPGEFCCKAGEVGLLLESTSSEGRTDEEGVPLALGSEGEVMPCIGFAGDSLRGDVMVAMLKWRGYIVGSARPD